MVFCRPCGWGLRSFEAVRVGIRMLGQGQKEYLTHALQQAKRDKLMQILATANSNRSRPYT